METQNIKLENIKNVAINLKQNPFLYFSLGSKELFHSDFLHWVILNYGKFITKEVINKYILKNSNLEIDIDKVAQRELYKFDLYIPCKENNIIIIENKVKSLAYKNQLERYTADAINKNSNLKYHFILLSFNKPCFFNSDGEWETEGLDNYKKQKVLKGTKWIFLSYYDLIKLYDYLLELHKRENIFDNEEDNKFYEGILFNYSKFIEQLHIIQNDANISVNEKYSSISNVAKILKKEKTRLHDLYQKIAYDKFAELIYNELKNKNIPGLLEIGDNKKNLKEGKFYINSDYQLAGPLVNVSFLYRGQHGKEDAFVFQIQTQLNNFSLQVAGFTKKGIKKMNLVVSKLYNENLWFNFYKKLGFKKNNIKQIKRKDKGYLIKLNKSKGEIFGKFGGDDKSYLALRKVYVISEDLKFEDILKWFVYYSKHLIKLYKNKKLKKYIDKIYR